jgi:hypothetical protein
VLPEELRKTRVEKTRWGLIFIERCWGGVRGVPPREKCLDVASTSRVRAGGEYHDRDCELRDGGVQGTRVRTPARLCEGARDVWG